MDDARLKTLRNTVVEKVLVKLLQGIAAEEDATADMTKAQPTSRALEDALAFVDCER